MADCPRGPAPSDLRSSGARGKVRVAHPRRPDSEAARPAALSSAPMRLALRSRRWPISRRRSTRSGTSPRRSLLNGSQPRRVRNGASRVFLGDFRVRTASDDKRAHGSDALRSRGTLAHRGADGQMSGRIDLVAARSRLATPWLGGGAIIGLFLFVQTVAGKYGGQTDRAWGWFVPTVTPTLTVIVTLWFEGSDGPRVKAVDASA